MRYCWQGSLRPPNDPPVAERRLALHRIAREPLRWRALLVRCVQLHSVRESIELHRSMRNASLHFAGAAEFACEPHHRAQRDRPTIRPWLHIKRCRRPWSPRPRQRRCSPPILRLPSQKHSAQRLREITRCNADRRLRCARRVHARQSDGDVNLLKDIRLSSRHSMKFQNSSEPGRSTQWNRSSIHFVLDYLQRHETCSATAGM